MEKSEDTQKHRLKGDPISLLTQIGEKGEVANTQTAR
jgi:hypothetical protein